MNEQLGILLQDTVDSGLYQIVLSNPRKKDGAFKIKIRPVMLKDRLFFQETVYQGTKVFHENYERGDLIAHIENMMHDEFKQCEIEHRTCKAVILVSKKGKMTVKRKQIDAAETEKESAGRLQMTHNRVKRYILEEGIPVPFLVDLGVQTKEGRIVHARYDKFKQINRFLEFIEDILPAFPKDKTVRIIDFGCGKSYLTFAMYYYLHELKGYDVEITGLDLKEDVIAQCSLLAQQYGYDKLHFFKGDIAHYEGEEQVDMVVTLHACDTATDYALEKAVRWNAKVILSVPCCQHEVNKQIKSDDLAVILQYGIIKERMSALITDAVRAKLLESQGYETNILEFIDMEHTPKNLLIRAVKRSGDKSAKAERAARETAFLTEKLQIEPTLQKLLSDVK
ncbi:MAG: SAM-dependent methyltransferase [Lachnospiraceae bacterium]|nr:SAM-dependent methyltransferase [Lachnospiraceae bacterium]